MTVPRQAVADMCDADRRTLDPVAYLLAASYTIDDVDPPVETDTVDLAAALRASVDAAKRRREGGAK